MSDEIIRIKQKVVNDFQTSEAMKTIRTNLLFCGSSVKAIALTSVFAGEGKSSMSFQLAVSMAHAGKNVLLVDADLRNSVLVNSLGVHTKVDGLTHYLSSQTKITDILHPTDVQGLYLAFSGARVANPSEILGTNRFEKFIKIMKEHFDYIIVDTPPLGQVIDCAVMAPVLDGVVIVIDSTNNSYRLEQKIKNQLEKAGAHILGVILNKVNLKERSSYYGKSYGKYGYGKYGYRKYGYGKENIQ